MHQSRSIARNQVLHQTAILDAKKLAIEHRNLLELDPEVPFPTPDENEEEAYAVLLALGLISANSYQWTERGITALNLCDEDFVAVFTQHLDEVLFPTDERPTIPVPGPLDSQDTEHLQIEIELEPESEKDSEIQNVVPDPFPWSRLLG